MFSKFRSQCLNQAGRFFNSYHAQSDLLKLSQISSRYLPKAVNFDIAGTLVDDGCIVPYIALRDKFREYQLPLTHQQIVGPMGMEKREHIAQIARELKQAGKTFRGAEITSEVVDQIHREFTPYLNELLKTGKYNALTPHARELLDTLKSYNLPWALTSGYARQSAELAANELLKAYQPHAFTASDQVDIKKRIEMIKKNLQLMQIPADEIHHTLFFTDAISDVVNVKGAAAHPFVIAIAGTSTHMEKTGQPSDFEKYQAQRKKVIGLFEALPKNLQPHLVIEDLRDAPRVLLAVTTAIREGYHAQTISSLKDIVQDAPKDESLTSQWRW